MGNPVLVQKKGTFQKGHLRQGAACREKALLFFKSIRQRRKTGREIIFLGNRVLEEGYNILKHICYTPVELCHF